MNKKWYTSKTLWVNFLGIVGIAFFGIGEIPPELLAMGLAVINMILRWITKGPVTFTEKK